jgi:hypothetical protein
MEIMAIVTYLETRLYLLNDGIFLDTVEVIGYYRVSSPFF